MSESRPCPMHSMVKAGVTASDIAEGVRTLAPAERAGVAALDLETIESRLARGERP